MPQWSSLLLGGALGAVALVVVAGFFNMFRGGRPDVSQNLMRWRVGLQFVALVIVMAILFFR
jgi:hypothetical protein